MILGVEYESDLFRVLDIRLNENYKIVTWESFLRL